MTSPTTTEPTADYHEADDDGNDVPLTCADCRRPTLYDYATDDYHHAIDAGRGCFLIPAEADRADDLRHPLVCDHAKAAPIAGSDGLARCLDPDGCGERFVIDAPASVWVRTR